MGGVAPLGGGASSGGVALFGSMVPPGGVALFVGMVPVIEYNNNEIHHV